jgi:hypothetical protein
LKQSPAPALLEVPANRNHARNGRTSYSHVHSLERASPLRGSHIETHESHPEWSSGDGRPCTGIALGAGHGHFSATTAATHDCWNKPGSSSFLGSTFHGITFQLGRHLCRRQAIPMRDVAIADFPRHLDLLIGGPDVDAVVPNSLRLQPWCNFFHDGTTSIGTWTTELQATVACTSAIRNCCSSAA